MAYYGNLALRPERKPQQPAQQPVRQKEKVVRRRQLPIAEKLLYLFTVALCVIVAGFIIYRYAEIYHVNRQIQDAERQYNQTTLQMKELQREVERLSDPKLIMDRAKNELGMVQLDPGDGISIGESDKAVAMNTKK